MSTHPLRRDNRFTGSRSRDHNERKTAPMSLKVYYLISLLKNSNFRETCGHSTRGCASSRVAPTESISSDAEGSCPAIWRFCFRNVLYVSLITEAMC